MKRRILSALCCALLCSVMIMTAFAVEVPDYDRRGTISVTMTYQEKAVAGGNLTIYRVADVVRDDGSYLFEYTADFAECEIPVEELSSSRIADELAKIAKKKSIKGITKTINSKGQITFSDVEIGLYLVVQSKAAPGYSAVTPFLVSVPRRENERYIYDVDATPKMDVEPQPTKPTSTTPSGRLPQTGQLSWPVPVMLIVGLLFLVGGWHLYTSGKRKNYEG